MVILLIDIVPVPVAVTTMTMMPVETLVSGSVVVVGLGVVDSPRWTFRREATIQSSRTPVLGLGATAAGATCIACRTCLVDCERPELAQDHQGDLH